MYFVIYVLLFSLVQVDSNKFDINNTREKSVKKTDPEIEETTINFSNKSVVSELQRTICSIKTDDIVAKAQSTATRILTGVCTSEEMLKAMKSIENIFLEKLEEVKHNLTKLIQSKFEPNSSKKNFKNFKPSPFRTIDDLLDKSLFKNLT